MQVTGEVEQEQPLFYAALAVMGAHLVTLAFTQAAVPLLGRDLLAGAAVGCAGTGAWLYRDSTGLVRATLVLLCGLIAVLAGVMTDGLTSGFTAPADYTGASALFAGAWLCVHASLLLAGRLLPHRIEEGTRTS